MRPRVRRHFFTVPKAVAGLCLLFYGVLSLYAQFGLQPKAAYLFSGTDAAEADELIIPEYIESVSFYAGWNGFRARVCRPVFSSPEQEGFPPAAVTLPGCATVTIPYFSRRMKFFAPNAEARIVYNGTHRLVTRSELKGEILFSRRTDARTRIRRLMLGETPLSVRVWTENIRFYSERPGSVPAYAAAEHLSVWWESAGGNTAVASPGSRMLVSVKHIIAGAEQGAADDRQLFPVSFTGEFRMLPQEQEDEDESDMPLSEAVLVDAAKLFFRDFAIIAYGKALPASETQMYPTVDMVVEIDNYDNAVQSALPARALLPKTPRAYDRGSRIADKMINALTQEQESAGQLRRVNVTKHPGEPLLIGGKTVIDLQELYRKTLNRTK